MSGASAKSPLTIVLVDDSLLLRQVLSHILSDIGGVEVVGTNDDEASAIELLQRTRPDCAIIDLELRTGSGLGVLRALSENPGQFGRVNAIVFTNHGQPVLRKHCQALGVYRFFDKATEIGDLLACVSESRLA